MKYAKASICAWATKRGGAVRTTGVALSCETINPTDTELARGLGSLFDADFGCTPTAFGKVLLVNPRAAVAGTYQVCGSRVEPVHCGNATAGAAAVFYRASRQRNFTLQIVHPHAPISVSVDLELTGVRIVVHPTWLVPRRSVTVVAVRDARPLAVRVSGLNEYLINVVPDFPSQPPATDRLGDKVMFLRPGGNLCEAKVATCGRWHGAMPQSGAMALAIARLAVPDLASVVPLGLVIHPGGTESLPSCRIRGGWLSFELPASEVIFCAALSRLMSFDSAGQQAHDVIVDWLRTTPQQIGDLHGQ